MFSGWFCGVFWMIWWCFLDVLGMFSRWVCDGLWMFWECFLDDFVMFSVCFGHVFWVILLCFLDVLGMFSGWFCHVFWMFWECFLHDFVMFSGTTRQPIFTRWGLMSVNTTFFNPTIKNFAHIFKNTYSNRSAHTENVTNLRVSFQALFPRKAVDVKWKRQLPA